VRHRRVVIIFPRENSQSTRTSTGGAGVITIEGCGRDCGTVDGVVDDGGDDDDDDDDDDNDAAARQLSRAPSTAAVNT